MAHWEYKPPVRQFFLSVACYVVKPEVQKFKRKKKCREQKETRCFQQKTADFVELLPRFELGTSSLPILLILFPLVVPWFVLTSEAIALQRLRMFSYFVLVYHAVRFYDIIFGARMGFVWVSIQTQIWNGLLFDISPTAPISDPSPPPLQGNALAISRNQRYNENNIPISTLNQAEQKGSIIITYRKPLSIFELNEKVIQWRT